MINASEGERRAGRLSAAHRIEALLDPGSFEPLGERGNDGVIAGSGAVNGRALYVYAKDFSVREGALGQAHAQKIARTQEMALAASAPIIGLFDSGGARAEEGIAALAGYGEILRLQVRAAGVIPQIALIMGPCIGADAFSAALADFLFMVEDASHLFVTGPAIIRTVAGEIVTAEELGGADAHAMKTGDCDRIYASDFEALLQMRRLFDFLPASSAHALPEWPSFDDAERRDASLDTLVPHDPRKPYDIKELILKTVDEGDFFELKESHAKNIVTGFSRVGGQTVAIVANQPMVLAGALDADAARKAARFIGFCGRFAVPIISFVDTPGFLPGVAQEHGGLARAGAGLAAAYGAARAPKISVVTRNVRGGAYALMGSKHLGCDVNFAWPSARIALKGGDAESSLPAAVGLGAIDEVIAPGATRRAIARALAALRGKARNGLAP